MCLYSNLYTTFGIVSCCGRSAFSFAFNSDSLPLIVNIEFVMYYRRTVTGCYWPNLHLTFHDFSVSVSGLEFQFLYQYHMICVYVAYITSVKCRKMDCSSIFERYDKLWSTINSFFFRYDEISKNFAEIFNTGPQYFARAPGRVNIIGIDWVILHYQEYNLLTI